MSQYDIPIGIFIETGNSVSIGHNRAFIHEEPVYFKLWGSLLARNHYVLELELIIECCERLILILPYKDYYVIVEHLYKLHLGYNV